MSIPKRILVCLGESLEKQGVSEYNPATLWGKRRCKKSGEGKSSHTRSLGTRVALDFSLGAPEVKRRQGSNAPKFLRESYNPQLYVQPKILLVKCKHWSLETSDMQRFRKFVTEAVSF